MSILDYLKPWGNANFVVLSKYLLEVGYRLNLSHYTDKKWNHWALKWFMKEQVNVRRGKKEIWSLVSSFRILFKGFLLLLDHIGTFDSHRNEYCRNCILQKVECEKRQRGSFLLSPWPLVFSFPNIKCTDKQLNGRNVTARTLKRLINTEPQSKFYHYVSKHWSPHGDFYIFTEMFLEHRGRAF